MCEHTEMPRDVRMNGLFWMSAVELMRPLTRAVCLLCVCYAAASWGNIGVGNAPRSAVDSIERGLSRPVSVEALIEMLGDTGHPNRNAAFRAIAEIGPNARQAVPMLIAGLADPDYRIRRDAAFALISMGSYAKPALESLITALD